MFLTFPSVFLFFYFLVTCCSGCSRLHVSSFGWSEWRVNLHFWCVFFFFSKAGIDECQREALPLWHGTPVTLTNRLLRHQVLFFCQRGKYCDYWCLIFVIMRKISSLKKCSVQLMISTVKWQLWLNVPFLSVFCDFLQFFGSVCKPNCVFSVAIA